MSPDAVMFVGRPSSPRYKQGTIVMLTRRKRSKWWKLICFGQKTHYRKDGSCSHTDELLASLNPERVPPERVQIVPFGERGA